MRHPDLLEQSGLFGRLLRELRCTLVIAASLTGCSEGARSIPRSRERHAGVRSEGQRVFRVGIRPVGLEVMGRDHLDDLVVVTGPRILEQPRDREVLRLAVTPGERLVRDPLHQGLQEPELSPLGRTLVRLDREELASDESLERFADRVLVAAGQRGERVRREGLAEDRGVLQQRPVLGRETVQPCLDQRVERFGHVEVLDRTRRFEPVPVSAKQPSIQEHPHGLDGIERDPFGAFADLAPNGLG